MNRMKSILLTFLFVISCYSQAASKWQKLYGIVQKDIKTIEALKSRDLTLKIRLFELYGERLTLILEKESEYKISYLENNDKTQLKQIERLKQNNLIKINKISESIEKQTRDRNILGKINYYKALNYYLVKNYKVFYKFIKIAEKQSTDEKLNFKIRMKLADYYYNEKKYKRSKIYYLKILKVESRWKTRFHFNLAWSYLKLSDSVRALKHVKIAYELSKDKNNFIIGDQLINSIIMMYAYANKTKEGIKFLKENKLASFDILLKYLHYTFEHGEKLKLEHITKEIESLSLTPDQEYQLLAKKVLIMRTLRQRRALQREFLAFKKKIPLFNKSKKPIKFESKEALISAINSYTGYLQELIRSKRLIKEKTRNSYIRYAGYNFNILKEIDPKNALKYSYYEGETFFSLSKYRQATLVYARALKNHRKNKGKKTKYIDKTFDSLFKSLEKSSKPSTKILIFSYKTYIYYFPSGNKTAQIYERLLNLYQTRNDNKAVIATLKNYNKSFPTKMNIQRNYYKSVLNKYIDKKDINSLRSLSKKVEKGFLSFKRDEILKIRHIINQIQLEEYDQYAMNGELKKGLSGFTLLFNDKKNERSLRVNALEKKLYYLNKNLEYKELSSSMLIALSFLKKNEIKSRYKKVLFYTENICLSQYLNECFNLVETLVERKGMRVTATIDEIYFKSAVLLEKKFSTLYNMAKSEVRKNYLLQNLMLSYPGLTSEKFNLMINDKVQSSLVKFEVERRFWSIYFSTLDITKALKFIEKTQYKLLKNKLIKNSRKFLKIKNKLRVRLPETPTQKYITFQIFSKFNENLVQSFLSITKEINNDLSALDQNFVPQYLSIVITKLRKETERIKKYTPVSKDEELEKAINKELNNVGLILDRKIIELERSYFSALKASSRDTGARKYSGEIMSKALDYGFGMENTWLN